MLSLSPNTEHRYQPDEVSRRLLSHEPTKTQVSEQKAAEDLAAKRPESPPRINLREVADEAYRLMPYSLILEGERAN